MGFSCTGDLSMRMVGAPTLGLLLLAFSAAVLACERMKPQVRFSGIPSAPETQQLFWPAQVTLS